MEEIIITINRDGSKLRVEGDGFEGTECKEITRAFESAMGAVEQEELKPEYHNTEHQHRHR